MNFYDILFLALALSVDAFAVSFSYGLVIKKSLLKNSIRLGLATGLGQFIMPIIGWLGTKSIHYYIERYDHWIAFLVFLALGLNIIYNATRDDDKKEKLSKKLTFKLLFMIGIATSIDACVAGVTIYFMKTPILLTAGVIGVVSFINSVIGFRISSSFKKLPTKYMEIGAGIVLILLGLKILFEHLSE